MAFNNAYNVSTLFMPISGQADSGSDVIIVVYFIFLSILFRSVTAKKNVTIFLSGKS